MNKDSDPDFSQSMERAKGIEATDGGLGRHVVADAGVKVSDADAFLAAVARLGISSIPAIALIPRNLETSPTVDQLVYERESKDLQVLANQLGLTLAPLTGTELVTVHENDATVLLNSLYIAYHAFETLNGFATLVEFFNNVAKVFGSRRTKNGAEVELSQEIVISKGSTTKRLSYRGPASGLSDLAKLVQSEFEKNDET